MKISAKLRHLRIAPRKVRLVADLIRGKKAEEAQTVLNFTTKKAAKPLLKLLNSALASAKNNFQLDSGNLYVAYISVDEGSKLKRWMARARGQASEIQKKTSHVNLILDEIKSVDRPKKRKVSRKTVAASEPRQPRPKSYGRPEREASKIKAQKGLNKIFRRKAI